MPPTTICFQLQKQRWQIILSISLASKHSRCFHQWPQVIWGFCYSMCHLKHHLYDFRLHSILLNTDFLRVGLTRYSKTVPQLKKISMKQIALAWADHMLQQPRWGKSGNPSKSLLARATSFLCKLSDLCHLGFYSDSWMRFGCFFKKKKNKPHTEPVILEITKHFHVNQIFIHKAKHDDGSCKHCSNIQILNGDMIFEPLRYYKSI